jgi:tRNA(Arg) A34 adenosine deaminase TadA
LERQRLKPVCRWASVYVLVCAKMSHPDPQEPEHLQPTGGPRSSGGMMSRMQHTPPTPLTAEQVHAALRQAQAVATQAQAAGHHPFGAVLLAPDGQTVLLSQGNVDTVNHAEAVLAREAAARFDANFLWNCTLVTTVEPCAMCAGTQYWAHIGGLVYGLAESELRAITGAHPENPTLDLPCRDVFASGSKPLRITGPVPEMADEIAGTHRAFWHRSAG